jgi:UDPglucose--hexose-1-phosphate uridylyltransferase
LEPVEVLEATLRTFQMRGHVFRQDSRIEHIVYFKNHGPTAGASLLHPHTQIVAMPIVPYNVRTRSEEARRYFDDHGKCVICSMREEESRARARIVLESAYFSAFIPYAAFSPFHLWIIPRRHCATFLQATSEELYDLSVVLGEILRKLYYGLNDPDYNYVIRTAPEHETQSDYLHWYIAIVPHLTRMAGFEIASGMFINTALPEESAQFLREVRLP